jgi:coenzyme F420-reducing hydrogenase beta subunit
MDIHIEKLCEKTLKKCEICEEPKERFGHDCIQTLKTALKYERSLLNKPKIPAAVDDGSGVVKCDEGHSVLIHIGEVEEYNGQPRCNVCLQE